MKFQLIICDLKYGREFNARTETHDIGNVSSGKEALEYGRRITELWNSTISKNELPRKCKAARIIGEGENLSHVPLVDLRHLTMFPAAAGIQ